MECDGASRLCKMKGNYTNVTAGSVDRDIITERAVSNGRVTMSARIGRGGGGRYAEGQCCARPFIASVSIWPSVSTYTHPASTGESSSPRPKRE